MKPVFIVGCPRSGSTWVTFLMAQHPSVATFQHAKIFDYLEWMRRWWRNKTGYSFIVQPHERAEGGPGGEAGKNLRLAEVLPEQEFYPMLRPVVDGILDRVAGLRDGVSIVVDKTPENGHLAPFILQTMPDAYFLHIVRDPRSVFSSHRSAASSWARWEFPTQPVDGARFWKRDVEAARAIRDQTENYLEVRYEDLRDAGAEQLGRIYSWLGLDADGTFCEQAVAASTKDKVRPTKELPKDFVRKTKAGGWRDELSRGDVRIIEYLAGGLMEELGYELAEPRGGKPFSVRLHDALDPVLAGLDKRLHRLTQLAHWRFVGRKLDWPEP